MVLPLLFYQEQSMSERLDTLKQDEQEIARRAAFITGLQDIAAFLIDHPDLPVPYGMEFFSVWVHTKDEIAELVRGKGKWDKQAAESYMYFRKTFGPINYDINISRDQVCEKVVVGQTVIPARPATPEQVIDKIEWKCTPVLDHEVDEELGQS